MPTNFTYDLYAGNEMTFPEYAMRCARASGMLAGMRDDPIDAVIPDEFEANSYYIEVSMRFDARGSSEPYPSKYGLPQAVMDVHCTHLETDYVKTPSLHQLWCV